MEYTIENNNVVITEYNSFSVYETLNCGQCFRFFETVDGAYAIVAFGRLLKIKEEDGRITFFDVSENEFKKIWMDYFDLNRDYSEIKDKVSKFDPVMLDAVSFAPGIRILNQDIFECIISFIISQNNRIPMIKKVIENISKKYGSYITSSDGRDIYSFPSADALANASEEDLMECKAGFRAKYIIDAVRLIQSGRIDINSLNCMETSKARETLMSVKGIGPKVADCILLFSCGKKEVFPTDVWVKRVMSHLYFEDEAVSINEIHSLAKSNFGAFAGFAQQYLFYYAREFKIGA
ncbi:MAG: DNA glycosylase [Lachnospiraceae bacterium]|nr:DNA glycosylase [Lachnospiraceae bacterium]